MTITAPEAVGESLDPRDPLLRLKHVLRRRRSVELLHERDRSGVLAAAGTVNGVRTIAFCTDGTVMGGAMGVEGCAHIVNAYDTAIEEQSPIVGIWHSGGARLAEGVKALHAVGLVFEAMIRASGYVPQISVVVGFAAGGAAYGPALTDVIVMAPESRVFVTGPDIVRSVTGEDVDMASLGGPDTHHKKSGVCHIVADDELDAYERGRRLVGLFCQQGHFDRTKAEAGDTDLHALLPDSARRAYDVHPLVEALLDDDAPFEEFQAKWAPSMVIGLGRLSGPHRRRARQQPAAARRLPELRKRREGSAFRAAVRRVRHSAGRRGRRARLPARCRPGVGRRGAPRRQAAARVRRVPPFRGSRWSPGRSTAAPTSR